MAGASGLPGGGPAPDTSLRTLRDLAWKGPPVDILDMNVDSRLVHDLAAKEYRDDPRQTDRIRNIFRGLTRFRVKREIKGVYGRSFQGTFSQFAEIREEGLSYHPHRCYTTPGFLALPYLGLKGRNKAKGHPPSTLHLAKTLLQYHFRFDEYALDDDEPPMSVNPGGTAAIRLSRPLVLYDKDIYKQCNIGLTEPAYGKGTLLTSSRARAQSIWPDLSLRALKDCNGLPATSPSLPPKFPRSLCNAVEAYFGMPPSSFPDNTFPQCCRDPLSQEESITAEKLPGPDTGNSAGTSAYHSIFARTVAAIPVLFARIHTVMRFPIDILGRLQPHQSDSSYRAHVDKVISLLQEPSVCSD
ncbi:MAG: hypothetical protein Q9222_003483 [Ikaeria aurantiellina]